MQTHVIADAKTAIAFYNLEDKDGNNHNAKQATARVEEDRQGVKSQFANELPSFSVAANYLGIHSPKFNPNLSVSKNACI